MKYNKIGFLLALGIIAALLIPLSATPLHASNEYLFVYPRQGEVGDLVEVDGAAYDDDAIVVIYFSSTEAEKGDQIDVDVLAYEIAVVRAFTDEAGSFDRTYTFYVPDALTDGPVVEDVHNGLYYIYATYYHSPYIVGYNEFDVIFGSIEITPTEGTAGTEVDINGLGLRPNQAITIEYDGVNLDIASGDDQTDEAGDFSCAVIIPQSSIGSHTIAAVDESGDRPEAEFIIEPRLSIDLASQAAGGAVEVSGSGFEKRQTVTITLGGEEVDTTPVSLLTDHYGSFSGSFLVPFSGSYGEREVEAADFYQNTAAISLIVGGGIALNPATSATSPGYIGQEITVLGAGFTKGATVDISYENNGEEVPVASAFAKEGVFTTSFIVSAGTAGSHDITASDGTTTATAVFTMEAQSPPTPVPLTPEIASTAPSQTHFDWEDVSDTSGVSYSLQVAVDENFNAILIRKEGLESSEYTLTEAEKLMSTEEAAPYYWRVKAVDGAANESGWSYGQMFYIGFSWEALPTWAWYTIGIVGLALLGLGGYWLQRRIARGKLRALGIK